MYGKRRRTATRGQRLACERGFDRWGNPVDCIRFFDHGRIVEFWRRRIDVAASGDHKRYVAFTKLRRDRPNILAFEVYIEDGEIEPALLHFIAMSGSSSTIKMERCPDI
jgi:hypothetical protein